MKGGVQGRDLAIVAVPYLLILWGHVALPGLAAFASLLAFVAISSALLSGRDTVRLRPFAHRVPSRRLPRSAAAAADVVATSASMRATLRALEAELHVLEDQRRTELARGRAAVR